MSKRKLEVEAIAEDDADIMGWADLTVAELKQELDMRGLAKSGKKADLIARLETSDNGTLADTDSAFPPKPKKARKEASPDVEDGSENPNWANFSVAELKQELDVRGLAKSGKKADLVARLEASENGTLAAADATPLSKPKKAKKEASPDVEIEGPLASEVIQYQNVSRNGERRLRPFVPEPDAKYKDKLKRIRKERMFMLDRTKGVDRDGHECEVFDIAGSTGNIYQTTIGRKPNCICMDARIRGQKCKHINYALIIILKAPAHLCYQTAFLSDELASIFANAPITRAPEPDHDHDHAEDDTAYDGKRKPIDSDCPICVFNMDPDAGEKIVWCKASCGQNFHKECFEQWKRSKHGGKVTCVYCRAEWQEDGLPKQAKGPLATLKDSAPKIGSYRNIGDHEMYRQGK